MANEITISFYREGNNKIMNLFSEGEHIRQVHYISGCSGRGSYEFEGHLIKQTIDSMGDTGDLFIINGAKFDKETGLVSLANPIAEETFKKFRKGVLENSQ